MLELMHGDCIDKMSIIEDGRVDLVLTDPPYGVTRCKWDSAIPFEPMWSHLNRVTKENGVVALFGSQPFSSALVMSNVSMFKYEWVWEKPQGTGHLNAKKIPLNNYETISVFYRGRPTYNPQMAPGEPYRARGWRNPDATTSATEIYGAYKDLKNDNSGFRYPKRLQRFPRSGAGSVHPTQKPVQLMEYLIKTYTNEGDTVLDFAMGSGTTGVACMNLGRSFIGIELLESYYAIAEARISASCPVPG